MRSDAMLGALVLAIVVLLTSGLRLAVHGSGRAPDRAAQLEDGERVRLMVVASRRDSAG